MKKAFKKAKKEANQITWLPADLRNNPTKYVKAFFRDNDLRDIRAELWEWLYSALVSKDMEYNCNIRRGNLLFLYKQLNELMEANFLINQKATQKNKKANNNKNS